MMEKMKEQSIVVSNALQEADLPDVVKTMLVEATLHSLSTYADQRHKFQTEVVDMARETLGEIEKKLISQVAASKAVVDSFDRQKTQSAIPQAAHRLATLKGAVAVKDAEIFQYQMAAEQATEALRAKTDEQATGDGACNTV